jgi:hypothetical protein
VIRIFNGDINNTVKRHARLRVNGAARAECNHGWKQNALHEINRMYEQADARRENTEA